MKKFIVALVAMIATSTVSFGQSYNYNCRRNATYSYSYGVNTNTKQLVAILVVMELM